jgi:hypothetical protein
VTRPSLSSPGSSRAAMDGPNTISGILRGHQAKTQDHPQEHHVSASIFVLTCHNLKTWRHYYAHALISSYVSLFPVHVVLWLIDLLTVGRWQDVSPQVFDALTNDFISQRSTRQANILLALATWFGGLLKFC